MKILRDPVLGSHTPRSRVQKPFYTLVQHPARAGWSINEILACQSSDLSKRFYGMFG